MEDDKPAGTFSGARLVVLLLGSLAIVVGVVLVAFALFEPDSAPCAGGELATNPFVDGRYEPRNEEFASVREAEAFICRDVTELQATGWSLTRIAAERTVPIEQLVRGNGIGIVSLEYREDTSGQIVNIDAAPYFGASYFERDIPPQATRDSVVIGGRDGGAYRFGFNPDFVTVIWRTATLEHRATTQLTPALPLENLVILLESLD